jgi:hypothetical protein
LNPEQRFFEFAQTITIENFRTLIQEPAPLVEVK